MKVTGRFVFFWGDVPFTNFTVRRFLYKGRYFFSSEQAFMWEKAVTFGDRNSARTIEATIKPQLVKRLGRQVKPFDPEKWSNISEEIMYNVVKAKFDAIPEFKERLLYEEFRGKTFVEASPFDRIWGIGFDDLEPELHEKEWGENRLGKILTKLRDQYIEELKIGRI